MFRNNFQVLKIPARSMLMRAKSWITAITSTSATLAARRAGEGDLLVEADKNGRVRRSGVLIFLAGSSSAKKSRP
ncbi:hypothetical protein [Pseudomonas sp. NMS19W]|uniref:hypothetical protein n=1 Tax=Pseudomonas sp. NMS19W TaxID=3079768 RepID=UPI003F6608B6